VTLPAEFVAALSRHRITLLYAVPTMYILFLAMGSATQELWLPARRLLRQLDHIRRGSLDLSGVRRVSEEAREVEAQAS